MADRGYLQTNLTPDELTEFRGLKIEDDRKAWLAAFAPRDHGERAVRRRSRSASRTCSSPVGKTPAVV